MTSKIGQMKIAVGSSGLGHVARGIETWADDLGAALFKRNVNVTLFKGGGTVRRPYEQVVRCWQRDRPATKLLTRICARGGWRYGFGSAYQIEQSTFARSLAASLRAGVYDIVHLQDPWVAYVLEKARARGQHQAQVILAHGTEEPIDFLKSFAHVQELAPYYLDRDSQSGVVGKRWYAIPNFVDTDRFSPAVVPLSRTELGIPAAAFVILCVSAIKRTHKRVDSVIQEVSRLRQQLSDTEIQRQPLHLIVAGAHERESAEVMALGQSVLGNQITFLANFDRGKMPGLYRLADVMVHGSLVEMMPIALLEATATGLPVVAHEWPVINWIIDNGGTCVDARQPGGLAAGLAAYLAPQFRAEKSAQARARAMSLFSEEVVVQQIRHMYHQVLGQTPDGRPQPPG